MFIRVPSIFNPCKQFLALVAERIRVNCMVAYLGSSFEAGLKIEISKILPYGRKLLYSCSIVRSGPWNSTLSFNEGYLETMSSRKGSPFTRNARTGWKLKKVLVLCFAKWSSTCFMISFEAGSTLWVSDLYLNLTKAPPSFVLKRLFSLTSFEQFPIDVHITQVYLGIARTIAKSQGI